MKKLLAKIRKILKDRRTRQLLTRIVSITAAVVVFITTYALVLPAITMESQANCGIPAHQHDDSCYEERLICGQVESPGHQHTDACYSLSQSLICTETEHQHDDSCFDADGNLTCELAEHTHDDSCYEEVRELVCDIPESEGHEHTDDCYERVLACGMEAHTHSTACYSHDSELTASAPSDFAAVATTELGSYGATVSASAETQANSEETSNTWASDESTTGGLSSTATAAGTASTGFDADTAEDAFVPQLETIFFEQLLTKDTGIYYYHAEEGEEVPENSVDIADWKRVNDDTELTPTDLLRVYLRYTIPAGALNATNDIARYRLPSNLHLTDQQMEAINTTVNGIANQYVNLDTLEITDTERYNTYLGIEATEGTRKPSDNIDEYFTNHPDLEGQEYINAVVRAENVFDETTEEYLGQDLVFTFTPYTVQKNQHEYDAEGQPTKAGQKVYGWLCFDLHMDQIDWSEPVISTIEDPAAPAQDVTIENTEDTNSADTTEATEKAASDMDEDASLSSSNPDALNTNTITEKKDSSAEIVFAAKDKTLKIDEISTELHQVELNTIEKENDAAQDEPAQSADDSTDKANSEMTDAEGDTVDDSNPEGEADKSGSADDSATDTENQPESEMEINAETYPAVSFEDTITVQAGTLSTDNENAAKETPAETAITVSVFAEEETFPLGTTMQLGTVEDMDTVASAVEGAVEGQTRGFHAVDISFRNADGEEIEPLKPIKVSMTSDAIKQAVEDSSTAPVVVHLENPTDSNQTILSDGDSDSKENSTDNSFSGMTETDENASLNTTVSAPADESTDKNEEPPQVDTTIKSPVATIIETIETSSGENSANGQVAPDTLSFDAGSFSVYAVVYTVDFQWNEDGKEYVFSILGGSGIALSELLPLIGVVHDDENTESNEVLDFLQDIESIEFSNPELVWVGKIINNTSVGEIKNANNLKVQYSSDLSEAQIKDINEKTISAGDWALISLRSFTSEESLTIRMKDGATYVIHVKDEIVTNADWNTWDNDAEYIIYTTVNGTNYILDPDLENKTGTTTGFSALDKKYRWKITKGDDYGYFLIQNAETNEYLVVADNELFSSEAKGVIISHETTSGNAFDIWAYTWNYGWSQYCLDFYVPFFGARRFRLYPLNSIHRDMYIYKLKENYKINVSTDYNGKVSGTNSDGQQVNNQNSFITATNNLDAQAAGLLKYDVTAVANSGYEFDYWELDGQRITDETNMTFTSDGTASTIKAGAISVTGNGSSLVAHFRPQGQVRYQVNPRNSNSYIELQDSLGNVRLTGRPNIDVTDSFNNEQFASRFANPKPGDGYRFVAWTIDGEIYSARAFEEKPNIIRPVQSTSNTYIANFVRNGYYMVQFKADTGGTVNRKYTFTDAPESVSATANPNYVFTGWFKEDGTLFSSNPVLSDFSGITEDCTLTARFRSTLALNDKRLHYIITDYHAGSAPVIRDEGYLTSGSTGQYQPSPNAGESFAGMAINAGQTAVSDYDPYNGTAKVNYTDEVKIVRISYYYEDVSDIKTGKKINGPEDTAIEGGVKKYDVSTMGLHTEKTASPVADADGLDNGTRTFDLELESWNIGNSTANVGMVLDASGSMAWDGKTPEKKYVGKNTFEAYKFLSKDTIDSILDKNKTDYSAAGYAGYKYYIYEPASVNDKVNEYLALGYWNGGKLNSNSRLTFNGSEFAQASGFPATKDKGNNSAGWYYVNTSDKTAEYNSIGGGKSYCGLVTNNKDNTDVKLKDRDENGNELSNEANITNLIRNNNDTSWFYDNGNDTSGVYLKSGQWNEKNCPVLFYVDNDGYLKCFAGHSTTRFSSFVYEKPDNDPIKVNVLQNAVSKFSITLDEHSPESVVGMTRFSVRNFSSADLLLLNWTEDTRETISAINGKYSSNSTQKNYGLTGKTSTQSGIQAYIDDLKSNAPSGNSKYLIIFTDGKDTDSNNEALTKVNSLKREGYTIITVLLRTAGTESGAEEFLSSLASDNPKDSSQKLFFSASASSDTELAEKFIEIAKLISKPLEGYTVRDYIDPRFELLSVDDDGNYEVANEVGRTYRTSDGKQFVLGYDSQKDMYYVEFLNQTIPTNQYRNSVQEKNNVNVWSSTIRIQAKEDFLGGNNILSNGDIISENQVFYPGKEGTPADDSTHPSKTFPHTTVNPALLNLSIGPSEDKIYLGEDINPATVESALAGTVDSQWYYEYLKRIQEKEGTDYINNLVSQGVVEVPYYYLENIDPVSDPTGNHPGTDSHKGDRIGTLKYEWVACDSTGTPLLDQTTAKNSYTTTNKDPVYYKLQITYTPLSKNDRSGLPVKLEKTDPYNRPADAPVGTEQGVITKDGLMTIQIVSGQLVVEKRIKKQELLDYFEKSESEAIEFVFTLTKNGSVYPDLPTDYKDGHMDVGTSEEFKYANKISVTITKSIANSLVADDNGYITVDSSPYINLPYGDYTVTESDAPGYITDSIRANPIMDGHGAKYENTSNKLVSFHLGTLIDGTTKDSEKRYLNATKVEVVAQNRVVLVQLAIRKIDMFDKYKTLPDAEFEFYDTDDNEASPIKTIKTGADGRILIDKVLPGTYYLKEIDSPEGYDLLTDKIRIVVTVNSAGTAVVNAYYNTSQLEVSSTYVNNDYVYYLVIPNNPGVELPSTGGSGVTVFYLLGLMMITIAGIVFSIRKRTHGI